MMHKQIFALVIAAFSSAVMAQETHDGVKFEVRFINTSDILTMPIKDYYEKSAAQQVTARLQEAISTTGVASDCVSSNSTPAGLYAFKDCISGENPDAFFTLLKDDIAVADTFWQSVIANSTADRTQWIPARAYVKAYFGTSLSATNFAAWTASPFAAADDLHANPEHYYFNATVSGGAQMVRILEGWGGVLSRFGTKRTSFTVPGYSTPDFGSAEYPNAWSLSSDFPLALQGIGPKNLDDGATFGVLHIAVRDVAATEADPAAVEIYSAVWYPPNNNANGLDKSEFGTNFVADESLHMVVEIINDSLKAQSDCSTGLCVRS